MPEENERIAIAETKLAALAEQIAVTAAMQSTLDAVVRQSRKMDELIESEEFIKDRVWLRRAREASEGTAKQVKRTFLGVLTTTGLAAIGSGILFYLREGR